MRRRLLPILALLSLVMCMGTAGMWLRSYYVHDLRTVSKGENGIDTVRFSADGRFGTAFAAVDPTTQRRFFLFSSTGQNFYIQWVVTFGTLPFLWLLVWAIRREVARFNPRACLVCGYDLRASKERCPECGTPMPPTP